MSSEITYMDCWHYVAPLLPVTTDFGKEVYVMIFHALKEAEKNRIAGKKKRRRRMKRKRFIKLLMGRLGLTRNEANYVADVTRATNEWEKRWWGKAIYRDRQNRRPK